MAVTVLCLTSENKHQSLMPLLYNRYSIIQNPPRSFKNKQQQTITVPPGLLYSPSTT